MSLLSSVTPLVPRKGSGEAASVGLCIGNSLASLPVTVTMTLGSAPDFS